MKAVGSLMVDGGDASGTCSEVDGGRQRMGTGFRMERTARRFFFSWMRQSVFPEERQLEQGRPTIRASHRTLRRWQWTQAAEPKPEEDQYRYRQVNHGNNGSQQR